MKTEWIRQAIECLDNFLKWVEWRSEPDPEGGPYTVRQFRAGSVSVRVLADPEKDSLHMIGVEALDPDRKVWFDAAQFDARHLAEALDLLKQAADFLETECTDAPEWLRGATVLPSVTVGRKTYYIDVRLQELRNVDVPHDRIRFCGVE